MSGKLAQEIGQTKPFASKEEEAFLNMARTFEYLQGRVADLLKEFQLTPTQYNLLRILRGAGEAGITCSQAADRMLTPDPDMTRLLDRMETRSLIQRDRRAQDRRIVITRITQEGLNLAAAIDEPLQTLFRRLLGRAGHRKLTDLIETLEILREQP